MSMTLLLLLAGGIRQQPGESQHRQILLNVRCNQTPLQTRARRLANAPHVRYLQAVGAAKKYKDPIQDCLFLKELQISR